MSETSYDIDVSVTGSASLRDVANALAKVNGNLVSMASSLNSAINGLDKVERTLSGVSAGSKKAASGIDQVTNSLNSQNAALKANQSIAGTAASIGYTSPLVPGAESPAPLRTQLRDQEALNNSIGKTIPNIIAQEQAQTKASANASRALEHNARQLETLSPAWSKITAENSAFNDGLSRTGRAFNSLTNASTTTRYALYQVAGGFAIAGAGLIAFSAISLAAAISYEKNFANVIRTADDGTVSIAQLRKELVDLTESIPASFADLAEIATLGGQLGIAGEGIDEFTSVVARLTATTNLTADAAGTALGRFQALLNVPSEEFENLASSILKVGVNSVATETQIVAVSTQISSMADFAGFTADQVIGLAGALASVGAAPELSRGTITRTFSLISKAIAGSTDSLEGFAKIAGISAAEFSSAFGTSAFAGVFQQFLKGLNSIQEQGGNAVIALNDLGISSVRDVPLLLRLAGAGDVVARSFADAAEGYALATELQDQYGIIATTTAARIQILINSVTNLFDAIGSGATGPVSDLVDGLSSVLQFFTDVFSTEQGQRVGAIAIAIAAIGGVLSLAVSGFAFLAASVNATSTALTGLGLRMPATVGTLTAADVAARRAAVGFGTLKAAIGAIGLLSLAVFLPDISKALSDWNDGLLGIDESTKTTGERIVDNLTNPLREADINKFLLTILLPPAGVFYDSRNTQDIKNYDKALSDMAASSPALAKKALDQLRDSYLDAGFSQEDFNKLYPTTINALKNVSVEAMETSKEALLLAEAEDAAAVASEKLASDLGILPSQLDSLRDSLQSGGSKFIDFGGIIDDLNTKQKELASEAAVAAGDSSANWAAYADSSITSLASISEAFTKQITDLENFYTNIGILISRGAVDAALGFAELGPAAASALAEATTALDPELEALNGKFARAGYLTSTDFVTAFLANGPALQEAFRTGGTDAVNALVNEIISGGETTVPQAVGDLVTQGSQEFSDNPIVAQIQMTEAQRKLDEFFAVRRALQMPVDVYIRSASGGVTLNGNYVKLNANSYMADGGLIRGPGTGTSDSVLIAASNREFMIREKSASSIGAPMLNYMNKYGRIPGFADGGSIGARSSSQSGDMPANVNVQVVQNYPTTRDPIKQMKLDTESVQAGIWT